MNKYSRINKSVIFFGFIFSVTVGFFLSVYCIGKINSNKEALIKTNDKSLKSLPPPEISGWIAWWKEDQAYDMLQRNPGKITSVSPVWFMVGRNIILEESGKVDREKTIADLSKLNVIVIPTLGSELTGKEISPLFNNGAKTDNFIENLVKKLTLLGVSGIDIDLEGVESEDRNAFLNFLTKLSQQLKKNNLELIVTIHAQTQNVEWQGVLGQDLRGIGEIADLVRIMTYDKHSSSTEPGSIAPIKWIDDVVQYNSGLINKEKIVIGIPSYGYIWEDNGNSKGLQYDEFHVFLGGKNYTESRDDESSELNFKSDGFTGWLSDSESMTAKIKSLRMKGFNKFVIWHLGGMDGKFFDNVW
jgi:spore germination protein YaaH